MPVEAIAIGAEVVDVPEALSVAPAPPGQFDENKLVCSAPMTPDPFSRGFFDFPQEIRINL